MAESAHDESTVLNFAMTSLVWVEEESIGSIQCRAPFRHLHCPWLSQDLASKKC